MKKLSVVVLSLLAAGAVMAEGLTREQVVAELVRARNAGELAALNSENPEFFGALSPSAKSAPRYADAQRGKRAVSSPAEPAKTSATR